MTGLLYWAEPIDRAPITQEYNQYISDAADEGWTVFRPRDAFTTSCGFDPSGALEAANRATLATCSALIAFLPSGVQTIGVPAEIEFALGRGIPVAIVTDITMSWAIAGFADRGALITNHTPDALVWLSAAVESEALLADHVPELGFVDVGGVLPTRTHATDVGFDLHTTEATKIPVGAFVDVPTGVICNLPPDCWGLVTGRSSTIRKSGLLIVNGIIDPGFRGELFAGALNVSQHVVEVEEGQRLAQLILIPAEIRKPVWHTFVTDSDRGTRGFGSSGA